MPETGASGSVGAPSEKSEGATRQQGPPYGLPRHLFRFELEIASVPRWKGGCILLLIICSLVPRAQKQNQNGWLRLALPDQARS
jgi:hypothetical protein